MMGDRISPVCMYELIKCRTRGLTYEDEDGTIEDSSPSW